MIDIKYLKKIIVIFVAITIVLNIISLNTEDNTIKIGTKNLTEQLIIANIYKTIIEQNTDYQVDIVSGLDTTSFVHNALLEQDIDMYVEYTSTAYLDIFGYDYNHASKEEILSTLTTDYQNIGLSLNSTLGFDNSNALICSSFCNDFDSISDLDGLEFSFAAPAYFFERSDGYNLLAEYYDFSNVEIIKADPIIIYTGILNNQIDVGLGFTTDAKLSNENIKVLNDSDLIYPSYDAMLVVNQDVYEQFPELNSILVNMQNKISTQEIRQLNYEVDINHNSVKQVAESFIKNGGLSD